MIGLKQQYSCSSVINEFNFTELSDEMEELHVEHKEYTERLTTIFLQIIYLGKQNAFCARTGGSPQDFVIILKEKPKATEDTILESLGLEYTMHCGLDKTLELWTVMVLMFKHVEQSIGSEHTLGSTRADVILVRG